MKSDPASLERLSDIALPAAVPWWPPAPGWYVLLALLAMVCAWLAVRAGKRWRADAYRRAALRELAAAQSAVAIAELLRRTALARVPRAVIAELHGAQWLDWLEARCAVAMPDAVRLMLGRGIYRAPAAGADLRQLREYAARWIGAHRLLPGDSPQGR
jgi:hypothetical protein